jgi:hypothetical protein
VADVPGGLSLTQSKETNKKLHKALITSVMTYACPAWEFAADVHLWKLQRLQNKVLRTTGNFPNCTPVRELHMVLKVPYTRS